MGKRKTSKIVDFFAASVDLTDRILAKIDKLLLIGYYQFNRFVHRNRKKLNLEKKKILTHFFVFILIGIAVVTLFNSATAYEYSYHGKSLGYVKNQEDVIKVLGLVSNELTKEYGYKIDIDRGTDIKFKKAVSLDKDVDDVDKVLKKLTYLTDMEAEGYGIYINDKYVATLQSEEYANQVLAKVKEQFMPSKEGIEYIESKFSEKVEIKPKKVKLLKISSVATTVNKILSGGKGQDIYTVQSGDTYYDIGVKFDKTFEELKANNPDLQEDVLRPGQEIVISKAVSLLTVETLEKATMSEPIKFETETKKNDSMYVGDKNVLQTGQDGKQVVTAKIHRVNGSEVKRDVIKSEVIQEAVKEIVEEGTQERPKTAPTGTFIVPISGGYTLSSPFGWRWGRLHEGIDLACPTGTPIRAADGGTVTSAGWEGAYGMVIYISHGGGLSSRYAHCSAINVSAGEQVYQGQVIGAVGNTGRSYGSHLHFEIRVGGTPVDPMGYL